MEYRGRFSNYLKRDKIGFLIMFIVAPLVFIDVQLYLLDRYEIVNWGLFFMPLVIAVVAPAVTFGNIFVNQRVSIQDDTIAYRSWIKRNTIPFDEVKAVVALSWGGRFVIFVCPPNSKRVIAIGNEFSAADKTAILAELKRMGKVPIEEFTDKNQAMLRLRAIYG